MTTARLIHGDARAELPAIASVTVDVCITDPPYPEISRSYGRWTEAEWFALMRAVVPEVMRCLKPSGSAVFVLQPNSERVGRMRTWLWEFMTWVGKEWGIVQDAWWWKHDALPTVHTHRENGLLRPSLKACVWVGREDCYRNQDNILWKESTGSRNHRLGERCTMKLEKRPSGYTCRNKRQREVTLERGGVTPFNVIPIPSGDTNTDASSFGHGAGTPLALCSWWTRYLCPPGGVVLDPFAGSGTTGIAALKHGASYIGIEKEAEYVAIAQRRLDTAEEQTATPLFDALEVAPTQAGLFDGEAS